MRHLQRGGRRLVGAVGAFAAGFGAGQVADAEVVFQDFDPPLEVPSPQPMTEIFADLGNDGVNEFRFGAAIDGEFNVIGIKIDSFAGTDFENPPGSGNFETRPGMAGIIIDSETGYATNLATSTLIGPTDVFATPFLSRLNGDTNSTDFEPSGNFNDLSGFIGVEFELDGNTHYGYVGYEGDAGLGAPGRVLKIGYEDTPGLGIEMGSEESISGIAGDYNNDNAVDAADYVVWRNRGGNPEGHNVWRANFGNTTSAAAGQSLSAGAVPEPTSLALLAAGAAGLSLYRRRQITKESGTAM